MASKITVKGSVGGRLLGQPQGTVRNAVRKGRCLGWGRAAEERKFASGSDTECRLSKGKVSDQYTEAAKTRPMCKGLVERSKALEHAEKLGRANASPCFVRAQAC